MPERDTIVIGASAGGVQALSELVAALPGDLPAAVFIVLHIPPNAPSLLPTILARRKTSGRSRREWRKNSEREGPCSTRRSPLDDRRWSR